MPFEGGPMSVLFAATYPHRTVALTVYVTYSSLLWAPDNPWGLTDDQLAGYMKMIEQTWGQGTAAYFYLS
jgi:predicted carbohydrate-binding protein with CBM5 and CBM33 domain